MQELIEMVLGYVRGIWRNRWYALVCAWLVCVVGWTMVYQMPDQYRASARVYVDTQSILRPLMRGMAVDVNPGAQIGLVTRTLLSRPNLEKIARMTDLDVQSAEGLEGAIGRLQGRVGLASQRGDTNLYTVTYMDQNPQLARNIVQSVITVFGENLLGDTRMDTDTAQRFLDRQISEHE
ncbi:MAG: chain length determinant family protein, partial [Candidatus Competibacteraceae bacterium]